MAFYREIIKLTSVTSHFLVSPLNLRDPAELRRKTNNAFLNYGAKLRAEGNQFQRIL